MAMLDLASSEGVWRTPNTLSGVTGLARRLARQKQPWVACEATGRHGR